MHNHQSACPSYWYKSGCATLTWCIITLRFASSSSNVWLPFQAKNNVRSAPASTRALHSYVHKSHTEAITCILQIVTYVVKEKGMKYKG